MAEARVERRLAAILAADVAGYSRLMGVDEEGTLQQLKAHRKELVDPKITEHRGHIVKTTGDGMLVEFVSVVDAVLRCMSPLLAQSGHPGARGQCLLSGVKRTSENFRSHVGHQWHELRVEKILANTERRGVGTIENKWDFDR
jgi:hypothetical protein